jgi:hypothetical protein
MIVELGYLLAKNTAERPMFALQSIIKEGVPFILISYSYANYI